jgi:hypothetical protein
MPSKCPIQRAIARLKKFAGMPVPAGVKWINGKPDFRQVDEKQYVHHFRYKLCSVCGTKLSLSCYWIGGDRSRESHYFADGAMHRECAELSIGLCPFLNRTRPTYRGDDLKPMKAQVAEDRPEKMYLMRGMTSAIEWHRLGAESLALWAGKQLTVVKEF